MKIHDNTYYVPIIFIFFILFSDFSYYGQEFTTTADFVENTLTEIWVTLIYIYPQMYRPVRGNLRSKHSAN